MGQKTKLILIMIVFIINVCPINAQNSVDFLVLRSKSDSLNSDTIFGQIDLPSNGVFWNVKIKTSTGVRKYKTKEVLRLQSGNIHFAGIPYGKSIAIVPRILEGEKELYFYYTGSDRLSFIPKMQNDFNRDIDYDNFLILSESIWNATSNFYIFDSISKKYYKVPKAKKKFIEEISELFKSNEEIYKRIKNGVYKPEHIGHIIHLYNRSIQSQ